MLMRIAIPAAYCYNIPGENMRTITITKNDGGQRLDKFLTKRFRTLPRALLYKYLRTKYIKLNGKKASPETFLSEGDVLTLYIRDEFFEEQPRHEFMKAGRLTDIVYEDENILIADKKVGVICHQDSRYDSDALNLRVLRYLYEKGEYVPGESSFTPALCNRIDRNTGGLVIAAKNAEALRVMNRKIRDRELGKYYLCAVKGKTPKRHDILRSWLIKDEDTNTVRVFDSPRDGAKEIITEYTALSHTDSPCSATLCEILLHTGRTHQIRAHMAHIGCPLIGDEKYGDRKLNQKLGLKRQALYSYKLRFNFSAPAGELDYLNGREIETDNVWFAKDGIIDL